MSSLEESKSVVGRAKGWSIIAAILTWVCAFAFTAMIKYIKTNEWAVIACASVALIIGLLSLVVGIVSLWKNKKITEHFVEEFNKKHGVPLSLSLQLENHTYSEWYKIIVDGSGFLWIFGCLWVLTLLGRYRNEIVNGFDWWFAIFAHFVNSAVAIVFIILFHSNANYMKMIGRGSTSAASSLALRVRSPSPQNAMGRQEEIESQETRLAARPEQVPGQAQGEVELRARIPNATDADNVTAAVVEPRPLSTAS